MARDARGECPSCGMPIPFVQTLKRRGSPFDCQGCGASLSLTKVKMLVLMPLLAISLLLAKIGRFPAFLAILLIIAATDWKFARTRIADGDGAD